MDRNRTDRPGLTRESVLEVARALLASDGPDAISLRRIAAVLGVTAPALYTYFPSKRELIRAIAAEELGHLIDVFGDAPDGAGPTDRLRAMAFAYVDYARAHPALFQVMFSFRPDWADAAGGGDELPRASKAFGMVAAAVADAIATGDITERDPLLASLTLWSAVHGVATVLLAAPGFDDEYAQRLVASVVDATLSGLQRRT